MIEEHTGSMMTVTNIPDGQAGLALSAETGKIHWFIKEPLSGETIGCTIERQALVDLVEHFLEELTKWEIS